MDFNVVQRSVSDAWEFAWPPVFLLLAMLAVAWTACPAAVARLRRRLAPIVSYDKLRRLRAVFRQWGLAKVLPVIGIFLVVFFLFLTQQAVFFIGSALPPGISWRADVLLLRYPDERLIGCVASFYSGGSQLNETQLHDLFEVVLQGIEHAEADAPAVKVWQEHQGDAVHHLDGTKFLLAWVLLCVIAQVVSRGKWRLHIWLAWLVVFGAVAMYFLVAQLYAIEQMHFARVNAAQETFLKTPTCRDYQPPQELRAMLERLRESRARGVGWWSLRVGAAADYLGWVNRNVFRNEP